MATNPKAAPRPVPKFGAAPEPSEEVPVKKSRKKLWMMLIVILILAGGGAGGWYYWSQSDGDPDKPVQAKAALPLYLALDAFTVNLQSEASENFLQTSITLEVSKKEDVDLLKLHMPLIRNRLLLLLSSKKKSELTSSEGKSKLAQEIVEQVRLPFSPEGQPQAVINIHFISFVIQ